MIANPNCAHFNFSADVKVARLEDATDTGTPKRIRSFMAEITVRCSDCGTPFEFSGLEPGYNTHGARVSLDGLEARIAIAPRGTQPNPLQQLLYNVRNFDG
jgi:hypothetical protein